MQNEPEKIWAEGTILETADMHIGTETWKRENQEVPQTTRFDKPRGSPEELSEFLIRLVGSRKNPSRDNAHTF